MEHLGIRPSGAMDQFALDWGNRLLGNAKNCPALELPWTGGRFLALQECQICLTGAEFRVSVDTKPCSPWKVYSVESGQEVIVAGNVWGVYGYLCVKGGLQRHEGDFLLGSNRVEHHNSSACPAKVDTSALIKYYAKGQVPLPIRVLPGSDFAFIPAELIRRILRSTAVLTNNCNRQGYELEFDQITFSDMLTKLPEKISGYTPVGTLQMQRSGRLIALMRDRQTIGGLLKVFQIVESDINRLAQARPGMMVQFVLLSLEDALAL
jgi:allophanate hydrolase subunit 2